MRAPAFWSDERLGLTAAMLYPAAILYDLAVRTRFLLSRPAKTDIDIICIGNFVTGGAGKTPTAIAIAEMLKSDGKNPVFLSRGYGGTETGPALIDLSNADARQFGDEPLLLARVAPAIVAKQRHLGAKMAIETGADIVVMDDGMQNPTLRKSVTLAVIDSHRGIGNGAVFPAGPLRASLDFQFRLIDGLIVIGNGAKANSTIEEADRQNIPVIKATISPHNDAIDVKDQATIAYAGIGFPDKFFQTLKDAGANLVATRSFADHHNYTAKDAANLLDIANKTGGKLVTTEKDMARLSRDAHLANLRDASSPFRINLIFEDNNAVLKLIRENTAI